MAKKTQATTAKAQVPEVASPTLEETTHTVEDTQAPAEPEQTSPVPVAPPPKVELPYEQVAKQGFREVFLSILKGRSTGEFIRVNDILKSFYPPVTANLPAAYQLQPAMKLLRSDLQALVADKKIEVLESKHLQLGRAWYNSQDEDPRTRYYHLGDILIDVKLL